MPLRVGRRLAQLQQRKAAPIEPASLRLTNVEDAPHVGTTTSLSPLQWLPPHPAQQRHNRAALQSTSYDPVAVQEGEDAESRDGG